MKTSILSILVDNLTMEQSVNKAMDFLAENKPHAIYTPNPEMILLANKDNELKTILNKADLVIADGIGVVFASKINKVKIKERVAGCDFILNIFDRVKDKNINIYLLGSAPGVTQQAKENLEKKYAGLKIVGVNDGYFDLKKEKIIIDDIKNKKTDILLVGLGMGKQEKWIDKHKARLGAKILIGCGGSLDVFAGKVKRAPKIFQKLNLEWFYRLLKQPDRIGRQLFLPVFVFKVIKSKIIKN